MKFKAIKKNALPILKEVNKAVDLRSATSILRHMLLIADEERGKVRVLGYNNMIFIDSAFDAEVEEGGKLAILGNFINTIELSSGEDFILSYKDGQARADVSTGKGKYQISVMDPTDFPDEIGIAKENFSKILLTTKTLCNLIEKSIIAPDVKDERIFVQGVNIKAQGNKLSFTGVNSQMMAKVTAEEKNADYGDVQVTVYKSILEDLKSILPSVDIPVTITMDNKQIMFEFMDTKMVARLIDVRYPDKQVDRQVDFISGVENYIIVDVSELSNAIKCILNISNQDLRRGDISLKVENNIIIIKSETDIASGQETIDILESNGSDFTCNLNGVHLSKCLSALKSNKIKIKHNKLENDRGLLGFTGESTDKDQGVIFLILPLEYNK